MKNVIICLFFCLSTSFCSLTQKALQDKVDHYSLLSAKQYAEVQVENTEFWYLLGHVEAYEDALRILETPR